MAGRVLVVEDEEHIRSIIAQSLSDEGYKVVTAQDGAAALALIEKWEPDLIILDLCMTILDGWQFIETYRRRPAPHAKIIAMTAVVDEGDQGVRAQVEADGYLAKPFELVDLLDAVEKHRSEPNHAQPNQAQPNH